MLFQRTFHTVGQGAFYSEEISEKSGGRLFRMVYDCGSSTLTDKDMQKKAASDLGSDTAVDLLIVSHFDRDHINGIPALNPKRVMMPFLSHDLCIYLMAQARIDGSDFDIDMALHPERVFPEAQIIRIMPDDIEPTERESLTSFQIDLTSQHRIGTVYLKSNAEISVKLYSSDCPLWEYIPYNPNIDRYAQDFKKAVNGKHLVWESLQYGQYFTKHFAEIKKIYNALGNKNRHSLVVYSGSLRYVESLYLGQYMNRSWAPNRFLEYLHWLHQELGMREFYNASIMYFGDATISTQWLPKFYKELKETRLKSVSFIQIPHHGSYSSHGELIVKQRPFKNCLRACMCIISHGINNRYRHPSSTLISSLINEGSFVTSVTENPASIYSTSFHIR
ncbi:MAG: hypothetical protein NC418_10015 [Muribaculaceae bacterium]|nr:hypothetical protein [Muribaculaceae bacterium]